MQTEESLFRHELGQEIRVKQSILVLFKILLNKEIVSEQELEKYMKASEEIMSQSWGVKDFNEYKDIAWNKVKGEIK